MLTKRLEILFDPKEYEMIRRKAKAKGSSVASLVRKVLHEKIIEKDKKQKEGSGASCGWHYIMRSASLYGQHFMAG